MLQGLNDKEKQALQIAACCRWFDRRLIQHLLAQQLELNWENGQSCYDWLIQREFVEPIQRFSRLDDVARDVFRESLWQESIEQFAQIHKILADYFNAQADRAIAPDSHVSEKYCSGEWCRYKAEELYHICFADNRDIRQILLTHLFESHYFKQTDVIKTLFTAIASEGSLESHALLTESTRKFLSVIEPAATHGRIVLKKEVISNEELNKLNISQSQLEATRQICFTQIQSIEGLAKFAALIYKAKTASKSQRMLWLSQARDLADHLITDANPEFSAGLFLRHLGRDFFEVEIYEEAIFACDQALQIKPDLPDAWYNRGIALFNLGRNEEAIASFDQALQVKPDLHQAWYYRGFALRQLGRNEEAIASFDQALQIKPDLHDAWYNRGIALFNLARNKEAIASFDQALQIKPDLPDAWINRGNALFNLARYEEAISAYDKALQIQPDKHEVWHNRGIALFNLARNEEAISAYDKALQIQSDKHEAWHNRGIALFNLGRYEGAIASFDQALQIKPNLQEAWNNRGDALGDLGRYKEAIDSYDKSLAINPNAANTYYNKAFAYSLQNMIELALENLQRAIQLDPEKYREMSKTNSDFDNIRRDRRFQALIQ